MIPRFLWAATLIIVAVLAVAVVISIAVHLSRRGRRAGQHRPHGHSHRTRPEPADESVDEEGWDDDNSVTDLLGMERPAEIASEPVPEVSHDEACGDEDTGYFSAPLAAPPAEEPTLVPSAPPAPQYGWARAEDTVLPPALAPGFLAAATFAACVHEAIGQRAGQQHAAAEKQAQRQQDIAQWAKAVSGQHDYGDSDPGLFPYAEHAPSFDLWKSDSFVGALPPILAEEPVTWEPPARLPARRTRKPRKAAA